MSVPPRFGVLRLISTLFKVIAWIVLVLSILGALGVGLSSSLVQQSLLDEQWLVLLESGGVIAGLMLVLTGIIGFLSLYATGESIQLQLAVEENTRLTAALLLRMESTPQVETPTVPTYYGQVVN